MEPQTQMEQVKKKYLEKRKPSLITFTTSRDTGNVYVSLTQRGNKIVERSNLKSCEKREELMIYNSVPDISCFLHFSGR